MAATQLGLYNACLIEVGDRVLSSLSEDREPRRVLDTIYSNVVETCLQGGQWNFATRTVKVDADPSITPDFGFRYVFAKPTDWLRTFIVSPDEYLEDLLLQFYDDVNYWSADIDPLYIRYCSNDASFGLNLAIWPISFTRYVELALAERYVRRGMQDEATKQRIRNDLKEAKREALNRDAMNEAQPKFPRSGSWVQSRGSGARGYRGTTI